MTIRLKLVIFIILIVSIPIFITGFISFNLTKNGLENFTKRSLELLVSDQANKIRSRLEFVIRDNKNLSDEVLSQVIEDDMAKVKPTDNSFVFILDKNGIVLVHPNRMKKRKKENFFKSPHSSLQKFTYEMYQNISGFSEFRDENGYYYAAYTSYDNAKVITGSAEIPARHKLGWKIIIATPYEVVQLPSFTIRRTSLLLLFVSLLISVSSGILIIRLVLNNNLNKLVKGANELSNRNFNYEVLLSSKDEFRVIGNAFNTMVAELKKYNYDMESLVSQRTKALQDTIKSLKETQDRLVESEKMAYLGGLVAGVAHEINTPLGIGISSVSHLVYKLDELEEMVNKNDLKRSDLDNFLSDNRELLLLTDSSLRKTAAIVNTFKKVEGDQYKDNLQDINLNQLINEIVKIIRYSNKECDFKFTLLSEGEVVISSFNNVLIQIFTNLVNNSIQHGFQNRNDGEIVIKMEQTEESIKIDYFDNGAGICDENLNKIFNPFFTTRRNEGHIGLGLNIVYNLIVYKLKGSIKCLNNSEKGTAFSFVLPNLLNHNNLN